MRQVLSANRIFYRHLLNAGTDAGHIIRFAFDSAEDLKLLGESLPELEKEKRGVHPEKFMDFISAKTAGGGRYYLLLDEIQLLDCFELVLNGYLRRENLDVYVTAGSAERLSSNVAAEFAGRGDKVRLYPLSFAEFMSVYDGDRYAGLSEYLRCGGLPQVVLCADAREKEALLQDFLYKACRSVLARLGRRQSKEDLEALLRILSSSAGVLESPEKLKNALQAARNTKTSATAVRRLLEALEDAFLIASAKLYDIKGKACRANQVKYYFTDLGLRSAGLGLSRPDLAPCLETVLYHELCRRGYSVDVGIVPCIEKDAAGKAHRRQLEVDFVCNMGSSRCYIQSAPARIDEAGRRQLLRPFRKIDDSFRKLIVTADVVPPYYDDYGILTVSIYDFLLAEHREAEFLCGMLL